MLEANCLKHFFVRILGLYLAFSRLMSIFVNGANTLIFCIEKCIEQFLQKNIKVFGVANSPAHHA